MARRRMIDPCIWQSEDFGSLSLLAKIIWVGLISNADDEGKGRAKPIYIKSILFPYDDGMRLIDVEKALSEIGSKMSVTFYTHDGNEYYSLDNWSVWQKVEKPSKSKIPDPSETFGERSGNVRGMIGERSRLKEKEVEVEEEDELKEKEIYKEKEKSPLEKAIEEFKAFRVKIRSPMTDKAIELLKINLDKLADNDEDKIAILNQSILNGWKGVFALKTENRKSSNPFLDMLKEDI